MELGFRSVVGTCLIIVLSTSVALSPTVNLASAASSGKMNEIVGDSSRDLYVADVQGTVLSGGGKRIDVDLICKNKEATAESCLNPFYLKLKDNEGAEYSSELYESNLPSIRIPSGDIVSGTASFEISTKATPSQLIFSELFGSKLVIDLTATKMPGDSPPISEWILSSNKGVVLSDGRQELRIHDERMSGASYQLDISITNISDKKISYNLFYAYVKDDKGIVYNREFYAPEPRFSSGDLQPGEKVRGWLAFETSGAKGLMFIYDVLLGSYFATGTYVGSQSEKAIVPKVETSKELIINTDKQSYQIGETVTISGRVHEVSSSAGSIVLFNPKGEVYTNLSFYPNPDGSFSAQFELKENRFAIAGIWKVRVSYLSAAGETSITVSIPPVEEKKPSPQLKNESTPSDISVAMKLKKNSVLLALNNKGENPVYGFEIKTADGSNIRYVKAKAWERQKIDQSTVIIHTTDRPLIQGRTMIVFIIVNDVKPWFEWKALDINRNVLAVGELIPT